MLADKEQSFNILRGNIFQSQILCMAKLSRTKQCLLRHPCFKKGVLHKNERVKKKNKKTPPTYYKTKSKYYGVQEMEEPVQREAKGICKLMTKVSLVAAML